MMHMSFWLGTNLEDFLFKGLNISSSWGVLVLCIILVVSVWLQQALRLALAYAKAAPRHAPCQDHTNLITTSFRRIPRWREMLSEGGLYVLEVVAAYLLMLVVMTYNGWLVAAVILGYGAAYGTLGHKMAALSHRPLIPCAHCILASQSMDNLNTSNNDRRSLLVRPYTGYTSFGSSTSVGPASTPVVSQVDLVPPPGSCCQSVSTTTQASVHL